MPEEIHNFIPPAINIAELPFETKSLREQLVIFLDTLVEDPDGSRDHLPAVMGPDRSYQAADKSQQREHIHKRFRGPYLRSLQRQRLRCKRRIHVQKIGKLYSTRCNTSG